MSTEVKHINLYTDWIWSLKNETGKPITLYWSNGAPFVINPGDPMYVPKQIELFNAATKYRTIGFGGARGGTKSYACRALMIERLIEYGRRGFYNVNAAIFCENFPALQGRHIDRIRLWPDWLGKYYPSRHEFILNEELGSGHLKLVNLDNPEKYASWEFAAVFIDELTFHDEATYNHIVSSVRWAKQPGDDATESQIKDTLVVWASNPGRVGHAWVKSRFVKPVNPEPDTIFIQSKMIDNPFFDETYRKRFDKFPPKLRAAWVDGSWDSFEGQYFPNLEEGMQFIPPIPLDPTWQRYRVIDHGYRHPTVCLWGAVDGEGTLYIYQEYSSTARTADVHKGEIHRLSRGERYTRTIGDPALKRVDGSVLGNKTPWEVYNDPNDGIGSFMLTEAPRDRVEGWQALQQAFDYEIDSERSESENRSIFKKHPRIFIFNTCPYTWSSLTGLVYDDNKIEDAKKTKGEYGPGEGDDEAECLRYLWATVGVTNVPFERDKIQNEQLRGGNLGSQDKYPNPYLGGQFTPEVTKRIENGTFF